MIVIRQNSTLGLHMCVWSGNIRSYNFMRREKYEKASHFITNTVFCRTADSV